MRGRGRSIAFAVLTVACTHGGNGSNPPAQPVAPIESLRLADVTSGTVELRWRLGDGAADSVEVLREGSYQGLVVRKNDLTCNGASEPSRNEITITVSKAKVLDGEWTVVAIKGLWVTTDITSDSCLSGSSREAIRGTLKQAS